MQLKEINNTLKKILCSDDKNTQQVHNKCCTGRKKSLVMPFHYINFDQNGRL